MNFLLIITKLKKLKINNLIQKLTKYMVSFKSIQMEVLVCTSPLNKWAELLFDKLLVVG
jgi:hypothetical protein